MTSPEPRDTTIEPERFVRIVESLLAEMLQATVESPVHEVGVPGLVTQGGSRQSLHVKPHRDATYYVPLTRPQGFEASEQKLAADFVGEVQAIASARHDMYFEDLLAILPRRVVANHVGIDRVHYALERFESWSGQTYEGKRISAAIGFINSGPTASGGAQGGKAPVSIEDVLAEREKSVIAHGIDTLMAFGPDGSYLDFTELDNSTKTYKFAPQSVHGVASWTRGEGRRIALVLNERGEILVLQNGVLVFARRAGLWRHYIHSANLKRIPMPRTRAVREAIYTSCLDMSFERDGGCIGVIPASRKGQLIAPRDRLDRRDNPETRVLAAVVSGRKFQALGRRIRCKLLALDGAVVLDPSGGILAAGAILPVTAGSESGGRRAAARALGRHGLGIKISADGDIVGFAGGEDEVLRT